MACGFDHTLVLSEDGSLFTFGDNSLAQLGRPSQPQVRCGRIYLLASTTGLVCAALCIAL